ncbi:Queuine tRNA-ribosyltransferase catalytic subunit 1 [Mycena sanguinolenta]|uniref:Queuine tRNA-ribosyltransferase catalytic subunit 1 n=1 Tax=Mycena sanguinolenta TaxID=230812 RepID=A0A8H6ZH38_9AGAR|nr:Queuine tRNA-ribosyltransferase catalytic subunit 1 [Mycena sanguinolenta]
MAKFEILARCSTTRARVSRLTLAHGATMLPTFMPVATQGAIKGLTSQQVESLGITLILNNTYHLNLRPGTAVLVEAGGAHKFQGFRKRALSFESPFTGEPTMLTPEESISIQHAIGADIIMQLDDVVPSLTPDRARVEEAMERSVRWLDRCIAHHNQSGKQDTQNLFAIVQGGLDLELRDRCVTQMIERKDQVAGFAVGGLSGGEEKDVFWRVIDRCTQKLPEDRPRYSMGIGFAEDLLVCVALGIDMADCVFPTRTARFGIALTHHGPLNLRLAKYAKDFGPIDPKCPCPTCTEGTSRAMLNHIITKETTAAQAVTIHNITFQAQLMGGARDAIMNGTFPSYLRSFFANYFGDVGYPEWCINALRSVGIDLLEGSDIKVVPGSGAKWE